MIKNYINYNKSKNAIITIAIGKTYLKRWEIYAKPSWELYCKKYNINLFVVTEDLISEEHKKWKKATWQKLLIGKTIKNYGFDIDNICYLDTDILISPNARNIFNNYNKKKYGLVSKVKGLPFHLNTTLKKIAYFRNLYYDNGYPLDSALFMDINQVYKFSKLSPQDNYACAGVIVFNVDNHCEEMNSWFMKYDVNTVSTTGGDQTHINWEIQNTNRVSWIDYEFQALWLFEMASKYTFLYNIKNSTEEDIKNSIRACLMSVDFLHFAGSWPESNMWLYQRHFS